MAERSEDEVVLNPMEKTYTGNVYVAGTQQTSSDGNTILLARTDQSLSDSSGANGLLNSEHNIYLMNIATGSLKKSSFRNRPFKFYNYVRTL